MKTSADSVGHELNSLLAQKADLLSAFGGGTSVDELRALNYDWTANTINPAAHLFSHLSRHGFTVDTATGPGLTNGGRLFLSRTIIDFRSIELGTQIAGSNYVPLERRVLGKNSAIFFGRHAYLHTKVLVKALRPGAASDILQSLSLMGSLPPDVNIIKPIDYFQASVEDIFNRPVTIDFIVFPVVHGVTLKQFLGQKSYQLNSHIAISFVEQVGSALAALEALGAYHGDLHDENIVVETLNGYELKFNIIDVSYGAMGSLTTEECRNSDIENFRHQIWRILQLQKSYLPGMSLRKFLKTKYYLKLSKILSGEGASFTDIIAGDAGEYDAYIDRKKVFLSEKFNPPATFRLQRYEEIIDPSVAARLFVPFPELMSKVSGFSNVYVSGNRGSGKSTYLAALAFFPQATGSGAGSSVDFRDTFGVYFPCRQGEFKGLTPPLEWSSEEVMLRTSKVLMVKIIRRALEAIAGGIATGRILVPDTLLPLREYLNAFVPVPGIVSAASQGVPEIENFASAMVRVEMNLLASFTKSGAKADASDADFTALVDFFSVVRRLFSELAATRFHILFDDAGRPNLPESVQRVICDLILTSNSIFCVKWSAEKFTFAFKSSLGKIPENGHDYFEHDISRMLFIGSATERLPRQELEEHFRRIVEQRLIYFGYRSGNICDYVGDNVNIADQLIGLLASGRRNAYYCGWTAIWNIADRTPRNLLEIVSEIFALGSVTSTTKPVSVPIRSQDKAIRTISDKRLQSLSQVAGLVSIGGKACSLGRRLFEITATLGSVFNRYLKDERGKDRKRQHLAIERNDLESLRADATSLLQALITFGILDDTKADFARDDNVKKPIYVLNRIYCPAFNIMYRRDEHLRLSREKLEMLLTDPQRFGRIGTKRLAKQGASSAGDNDLFGYKIYE